MSSAKESPATVVVPARNLSREANLWYTLVSPEYLDRSRNKLHISRNLLVQEVADSQDPLVKHYAPPAHWEFVMDELLESYPHARALLVEDNFREMRMWCSHLNDVPRGLQESNVYWMRDYELLAKELDQADSIAGKFLTATMMSTMYSDDGYKDGTEDWRHNIPEDMGFPWSYILFSEDRVFPIPPVEIPEYAADTSVSCRTGEIVPWTGVWVPSQGMGAAALAFARQQIQIMQPAYEGAAFDEDGDITQYDLVECTWHPVKPTGRMIPNPALASQAASVRLRCPAGEPCPRAGYWYTPAQANSRAELCEWMYYAGYWYTPAQANSRAHFEQGQIMPDLKTAYGLTIWEWAPTQ